MWLLLIQQLWVKKQRSRSCSWSCVCAQHSLCFPAFHTVKVFMHYKTIKHPQCSCSTSNTTNCNTSQASRRTCVSIQKSSETSFPISLHSCRRPAPSLRGLTEHLQQSTIRWSSALTLSCTSRPICWCIHDCTVTFFLGPPPSFFWYSGEYNHQSGRLTRMPTGHVPVSWGEINGTDWQIKAEILTVTFHIYI